MTINRLFFKNSNFVQQKLVYLIGVNIVALEEARKEVSIFSVDYLFVLKKIQEF